VPAIPPRANSSRRRVRCPLRTASLTSASQPRWMGKRSPRLKRLQLADGLTTAFRDIVYAVVGRCEKSLSTGESVLAQYEAGSRPDGCELEYLKTKDHDFVATQIGSIRNVAGLPVFQQKTEFVSNLQFYVIVVTPSTGGPSKELSRSKLFLAVFSDGQYDRVRDPGLLFDERIDCMYYDGYLFIVNKSNFQRIFQFFEMVKKSARKALAVVRENIPISNFDKFEQACESHLQKLAKLKNISERPYLTSLTVAKLKEVISEFELPIKTVKEGGVEKLVFDPAEKWAILKLLDEDYLNSTLTGNKYEATGKRSITSAAPVAKKAGG
jgi:hypothetical protein